MLKISLLVLLTLCSSQAWAAWTLLTSDVSSDVYYDQTSIKKNKHMAEMRILADATDPKVIDLATSLSQVRLTEYDCTKKTYHVRSLAVYAGHMGNGQKVLEQQYPKKEWKKIPPKSMFSHTLKKACGSK